MLPPEFPLASQSTSIVRGLSGRIAVTLQTSTEIKLIDAAVSWGTIHALSSHLSVSLSAYCFHTDCLATMIHSSVRVSRRLKSTTKSRDPPELSKLIPAIPPQDYAGDRLIKGIDHPSGAPQRILSIYSLHSDCSHLDIRKSVKIRVIRFGILNLRSLIPLLLLKQSIPITGLPKSLIRSSSASNL